MELYQTNDSAAVFKNVGGADEKREGKHAGNDLANVARTWKYYFEDSGFKEHWFHNEKRQEATGRREYGVWVTCLVIMNLANVDTSRFLDQWWIETGNLTLADQTHFSFAAWLTKVLPVSLPDFGVRGTYVQSSLHRKVAHGK